MMIKILIPLLFLATGFLNGFAQQQGDTVIIGNSKFILDGENLISNPGFEDGFTGWTDATTSSAELSASYFTVFQAGGIDNSNYLVGTTNGSSSDAGSIGTGWNIEPGKTYYLSYHAKYLSSTAAAGSEIYLRISLTNNKSNAEEPLVLVNPTLINGGGQWTKNEVIFTNTNPSYKFVVARFRWLNNNFGFDSFTLYEANEIADHTELEITISNAHNIYAPSNKGAEELSAAIAAAEQLLTSNSSNEIKQGVDELNQAIFDYQLLNASGDDPLDVTPFIINPSFEQIFEGWANNGMATQSNSVFIGKQGGLYIERWVNRGSNAPNVSVSQLLPEIPNGKYELTVATGNIQQSGSGSTVNNSANAQTGVTIFAGNNETAVDTLKDRTVIFNVFDNQVEIGFKAVNATGNWLTCDNFRLHFLGFDIDNVKSNLQNQVSVAYALLEKKMQVAVRSELIQSINYAEQVLAQTDASIEMLASAISELEASVKEASKSIEIYETLQTVIDNATILYGEGNGVGADTLKDAIDQAVIISNTFNIELAEVSTATAQLEKSILAYKISNATGTPPVVVTNQSFARGATMVFGRSTITGQPVSTLLEHGFCWSTHPNPTILDNKTTKYYTNNGFIYSIENLNPSTVYYIRAYALKSDYSLGYGEVIKVITIPKGTVGYSLDNNVTGEHRERIEEAISTAVNYFNNLTSIQGHWISVNYGSGTPTAEASYGGWMRFGPEPSYQRTGTALHEMGHTIGVGTHTMWYGPSSPLRENGSRGEWLGERTKNVVAFLNNNPSGSLTGDQTHMWPYGINGAHEDSGSEILYIANSLISQALGEDGLPPTGGFATPAYTFKIADSTKYYLKSEAAQSGLNTSYIFMDQQGNLINKTMTAREAKANDSTAWQIAFNPTNSFYTLKNVASGRYFSYKSQGGNGVTTANKPNASANEYFQLMQGRVETQLKDLIKKGYWIIHPEAKSNPPCFSANLNENTGAGNFNISNASTKQRWIILSEEEVEKLEKPTSVKEPVNKNEPSIWVFTKDEYLQINNIESPSDITIYNLSGKVEVNASQVVSSYSQKLSKGIYILEVNSGSERLVQKISIR